jgi:hypothetical protein
VIFFPPKKFRNLQNSTFEHLFFLELLKMLLGLVLGAMILTCMGAVLHSCEFASCSRVSGSSRSNLSRSRRSKLLESVCMPE